MGEAEQHRQYYRAAVTDSLDERARYREIRKVTLVGALCNVLLAAAKIVFGIIGQSQSLIVDGVHSLSDLASDMLVVLAAKQGSQVADDEHPYGHARIETAFTVGLGVLLIVVGVGILLDAVHRLFDPNMLLHPGWLALGVAAASVIIKEALYWYTRHVAKEVRSNLLHANAWHHRSDAISSVIVIVGIAGSMAGLHYLDAIAAAGVSLMIAKIGWDLSWHSIKELVDTGLDVDRVEAIRNCILSVNGVRTLHLLRTRRMGQDALVDVHIMVPPRVSVSEGHYISESVRSRVVREINEVADVMVHIDPEDDETRPPSMMLPLRDELIRTLEQEWMEIPAARQIERVTLHYLDGKIAVDVLMPLDVLKAVAPTQLAMDFDAVAGRVAVVGGIHPLYH